MKVKLWIDIGAVPITLEIPEGTDIENDYSRYAPEILEAAARNLKESNINDVTLIGRIEQL